MRMIWSIVSAFMLPPLAMYREMTVLSPMAAVEAGVPTVVASAIAAREKSAANVVR